jgi:integrase
VTPAWAALRVREHVRFQRREAWSRDEAEIVLEEARKHGGPIYPLLLLALGTGMRLGEILGLQWRDVDWKAGRVTVSRSIDGKHREGAPKSGRGRLVSVPQQGVETLRAMRTRARSLTWVFGTRTGQVMGRKRLYAAFGKVLAAAKERGVPDGRTIHSARHTFASLALEAGQDPAWIARQLGHHSSDYTQRAYGHALERKRDLSWAEFRGA